MKDKIHSHYTRMVQDRIDAFQDMIRELTEGAQNDAKGSAGDKHETALSMMHIEQERLTAKLRECLDQQSTLGKINPETKSERIVLGSLIKANGIWFYVSAALPKIVVDGVSILAVSPHSPLGKELVGREVGQGFTIQTASYTIEEVI